MQEMRRSEKGIIVEVTSRYNGMLEQGGVRDRVVLVPWGCITGLIPERHLDSQYNDIFTYRQVIQHVAYGRWDGNCPVKVIRKGERIC